MLTIVFQLISVVMAMMLAICCMVSMTHIGNKKSESGETTHFLRLTGIGNPSGTVRGFILRKAGLSDSIALKEGCYYVGNRMTDDIYIDVSGSRIRCYLNVRKDKVYLTVIKGAAFLDNRLLMADPHYRVELSNESVIRIKDMEMTMTGKQVER